MFCTCPISINLEIISLSLMRVNIWDKSSHRITPVIFEIASGF